MTDLEILEESVCDDLIIKEFLEYINFENNVFLQEEYICESKMGDAIRWKLAKFSLRFLTEESINSFLEAYYSTKDGKPTKTSMEVKSLKKKEKVSKLRSIFDSAPQEVKDKIINSPAAKAAEKSAAKSAALGAVGVGIGGAGMALSSAGSAASVVSSGLDNAGVSSSVSSAVGTQAEYLGRGKVGAGGTSDVKTSGFGQSAGAATADKAFKTASGLASTMGILASAIFGIGWISMIVVGGFSAANSLRKVHKANVIRRDEMISDLIKTKNNKNKK